MTKDNKDQPAYPTSTAETVYDLGLTKREYIAAMCLQGLLANSTYFGIGDNEGIMESAPIDAIRLTDELLKQLEK